jgi:hypothetical protein
VESVPSSWLIVVVPASVAIAAIGALGYWLRSRNRDASVTPASKPGAKHPDTPEEPR